MPVGPSVRPPGSRVGTERSAELDDQRETAREICLRRLSAGPRTKTQLAAALARRDIDEQVAAEVLARLEDVGLVDDEAFAAAWVQTRHRGRGLARRALAHELRRRGVDDELVDTAVEGLDHTDELAAARELVARRMPGLRAATEPTRVRRLAGLLARKGYSAGLSYRVIREALEAEGSRGDALEALDNDDGPG